MPTAFALSLLQMFDRRILAILVKSIAVTLALFAIVGWAGWIGIDHLLASSGLGERVLPAGDALRGLLAGIAVVIGAWLLFRLVAFAVLQFFADEVVAAVESRHYPAAARLARPLGWQAELRVGLSGLGRGLVYNLAALPFALVLLFSGLGPAVLFAVVNAVLIGRELSDMVRMRHRDAQDQPLPPLGRVTRFLLGGVIVVLLAVPFVNFFVPVLGAAMATHLVHRRPTGAVHV